MMLKLNVELTCQIQPLVYVLLFSLKVKFKMLLKDNKNWKANFVNLIVIVQQQFLIKLNGKYN
jgi:hypothetical protein